MRDAQSVDGENTAQHEAVAFVLMTAERNLPRD